MIYNCFITWHHQARTRNLANLLKVPLFEREIGGSGPKRHVGSALWTCWILLKNRPRLIYLQYSFLLLVVVAMYKRLHPKGVTVVCDCHTKALRRNVRGILTPLFSAIKCWSFGFANLVIVSNHSLVSEAEQYNDRVLVLPDAIPECNSTAVAPRSEYVVFISSFAIDEPLLEVKKAAHLLSPLPLYWTGKAPREFFALSGESGNIIATGYLDYQNYVTLISGARCLVVLTTDEGCLLSGAYEGLAVGVPMVLSDTKSLRDFFSISAVYCKHSPEEIATAIRSVLKNYEEMKTGLLRVRESRRHEFESRLNEITDTVTAIELAQLGQPSEHC